MPTPFRGYRFAQHPGYTKMMPYGQLTPSEN